MNYLVIRDDTGAFAERTPSFHYGALAEAVELAGSAAHFKGSVGIDTDLYALQPDAVKLSSDTFVNTECEPDVSRAWQQRYKTKFSEKYVLARLEGRKGQGFLVVLFPRRADQPAPVVTPWLNGQGVKVAWQGQKHYVLLGLAPQAVESDGVQARASCLVLKVAGADTFALCLPEGGQATYRGQSLVAAGAADLRVAGAKAVQEAGRVVRPRP